MRRYKYRRDYYWDNVEKRRAYNRAYQRRRRFERNLWNAIDELLKGEYGMGPESLSPQFSGPGIFDTAAGGK